MPVEVLPHDARLPETFTPTCYPYPHKVLIFKVDGTFEIGGKNVSNPKKPTIHVMSISIGKTLDEAIERALIKIEKVTKPFTDDK